MGRFRVCREREDAGSRAVYALSLPTELALEKSLGWATLRCRSDGPPLHRWEAGSREGATVHCCWSSETELRVTEISLLARSAPR
jgi:hypothetical protein